MAKFTHSEELVGQGLLSKVTTTLDAMGKSKRDVRLLLKMKRDWPDPVIRAFMDYEDLLAAAISDADGLETRALIAMEKARAQEETPE